MTLINSNSSTSTASFVCSACDVVHPVTDYVAGPVCWDCSVSDDVVVAPAEPIGEVEHARFYGPGDRPVAVPPSTGLVSALTGEPLRRQPSFTPEAVPAKAKRPARAAKLAKPPKPPKAKKQKFSSSKYQGVTAFVGLPGSGKTYGLADVGVKALADGREVWCNKGFDLEGAYQFSSFDEFLNIPDDCVILVDEAPLYFNARKWQDFPDGVMYRLTQIRKDGLQLYYSTIDWKMVDVNLRRITFWVWECHSRPWFGGKPLLIRHRFPPEERRRPDERPRERKISRIHARTASAYDTHSKVAVRAATTQNTSAQGETWEQPAFGGGVEPQADGPATPEEPPAPFLIQ